MSQPLITWLKNFAKRREIEPYEDKLDEPTAARRGHHGDVQFNAYRHLSTDGHSSYSLGRSRSRMKSSRERRHSKHRSPSSSSSRIRSSSSMRRRRHKWAVKRFIPGHTNLRKLNAYKLIKSSIKWCLDIPELTISDYRAFLQHIAFVANRAKSDDFKDTAHIDYDCEIRKLAESIGFVAFSREFTGESVLHYAPQNLKSKNNTFNKDTLYKRSASGKKKHASNLTEKVDVIYQKINVDLVIFVT